jgi:hypothetical protein
MTVPVVSLYHLTLADIEYLGQAAAEDSFPRHAVYPQGYFVWMLREDLDDRDPLLSDGFWKCFERHFKNTRLEDTICIRFDEDGCELQRVPIRQN